MNDEDPSDSDTIGDESSDEEDTGLTDNQNRLLYLINLHTKKASNRHESDRWIRKQALSVLVYEGIVANVFDYDYAPQSALVENRRVWVNVSQEGQNDIEFLREEELVAALQISSRSYKPVICYQVTEKGRELLRHVPRREKEAVHEFAYSKGSRELLKARWDGEYYWLKSSSSSSSSGEKRRSTITDTEDVSYVSSAYVPQCLRYGGRPTMSNAHRAHESGAVSATDNIRDHDLDEVITLNSVSIIVAEYVPFGANQIVQLNNNVGSTERVQGGFISPAIDDDAAGTSMEMSPELTSVEILDYTLTNHINFEAEIRFAEETGVVQVETFGVSLNAEGTCFYGMQIEAVMDRIKDNISLDHLARILVDVQQDSSAIVDSVISQYQRDLLNLIFIGDAPNRNKVNLIIANEITPHLTAEEYMDKGEYENEFKQVIGDTKAAYDISEHDTLVFGAHGLLVCGPNSRLHEPLLCAYLQFITLDIFLQNYFARMWILNDDVQTTDRMIETIDFDPTALARVRARTCQLSKEIIQLDEILGYLLEALQMMEVPPEPPEQAGRSLYERLEIAGMRNQLVRRTTDVKKNIVSAQRYLDVIRERVNVASEGKMVRLSEASEENTKRLCALHVSNSDTVHSLQILQIVFAGTIAFDFLDRITGEWTVVDTLWMRNFVEALIKENMMVWFLISMIAWVLTALALKRALFVLNWRSRGLTTVKLRINKRIHVDKLRELLQTKVKSHEEKRFDHEKHICKITYDELDPKEWGGVVPTVTLEYDEVNRFLLDVIVQYNRRKANKNLVFNAEELREKLLKEMNELNLFDDRDDYSADALAIDKRAKLESRGKELGDVTTDALDNDNEEEL
mmetsp:Transcript_45192/g.54796  ORF Transcript_45192/g.54796 Transcript_45192/m.54796 type:complete len:856 (+) Transcript_45192:187-2754(+)|eukprot:CAMPEP_0172521596 /NCGR_PEP_ID=MMETSP1066-20121228/292670_1 /TAXON_ID=671091 /ORGANISM="Coscinodiscus wailesii, Strain CCMP2513" /LENGTH=855 /DNA_ID=CAMNT_0013304531 /DNA_START=166 /DNA_END=2733 /DNA_ORIENTATION=-